MCDLKLCKSGLPGIIRVVENIGDGAFACHICADCSFRLDVDEGFDLPDIVEIERMMALP